MSTLLCNALKLDSYYLFDKLGFINYYRLGQYNTDELDELDELNNKNSSKKGTKLEFLPMPRMTASEKNARNKQLGLNFKITSEQAL